MQQKDITITKSARYFLLGEPSDKIEQVWFVCHGYGELAFYFLNKFKPLDDGKTLIVAPEALNRFYSKGFSGRVGATWMTKEERLSDIKDNMNFLDLVYNEVMLNFPNPNVKKIALGFSQGCETLGRWVAKNSVKFDQLILCAGFLPDDVLYKTGLETINKLNTKIIYGKNDLFSSISRTEHSHQQSIKEGIESELIFFAGEHVVNIETLLTIKNNL
jgi:predicted esterase